MQVKIKLGKEWWMLPSDREFTKKELDLFRDVPYISVLGVGEEVRFFAIRKKRLVKVILANIALRHIEGFKPVLKDGAISFRRA